MSFPDLGGAMRNKRGVLESAIVPPRSAAGAGSVPDSTTTGAGELVTHEHVLADAPFGAQRKLTSTSCCRYHRSDDRLGAGRTVRAARGLRTILLRRRVTRHRARRRRARARRPGAFSLSGVRRGVVLSAVDDRHPLDAAHRAFVCPHSTDPHGGVRSDSVRGGAATVSAANVFL